MKTPKYNCSQSSLYQIGRNVCQSLSENLAAFTAIKPKYKATYVDDFLAEIAAAKNLPDYQTRATQSEVDYDKLVIQLNHCLEQWKLLKSSITATFKGGEQKTRIDESGNQYYAKATTKNWDAAASLVDASNNFLIKHAAAMAVDENMAPTFPAEFQADIKKFETMLDAFRTSEQQIKLDTQAKLDANNKVYETIMEICYDGQRVGKNNPALKEKFTFSSVLALVSGIGSTGIRGYILNSVTNQPIKDVVISSPQFQKTYKTNEEGLYEILKLATGIYNIQFSHDGFNVYNEANFETETGVTKNLSVKMTPAS